jgi:hypothetical protein
MFQSQGDPFVGDSSNGPFGWDWSSQISDAVAYSAINGFEIVERMRAEADALDGKRSVYDPIMNIHSNVPDEGEQKAKAILNEAANQLEQYLNDLGSDGMCSEQELQKFWEEAKIFNGADISNQMRNIPSRPGNHDQRKACKEAADKFKIYVNDLGTDGKCSVKDVDQFFKKFLSKYDNKYQACEAVLDEFGDLIEEHETTPEERDALIRSFGLAGGIGGTFGSLYEIAEKRAAKMAISLTRLSKLTGFGYVFGVFGNLLMESRSFSIEAGKFNHESGHDHYDNSIQPGNPCGDGIEECDLHDDGTLPDNCHCVD